MIPEKPTTRDNNNFLISVAVPVYNEEKNIPLLIKRIDELFTKEKIDYELIFSMDPCTDKTEEVILKLRETNNKIKLLKLSRRFGQPSATMAGIHFMQGDAGIIIDADLQDPPELIFDMIEKWKEGYHVVYAQRTSRAGETLMKRFISWIGYWVINKITNVKIPRNTGDFRLLDRVVLNHLKQFKDHDPFLRGLVAFVGCSQIAIPYQRDARHEGVGNYNKYIGSLLIGMNGIFGFSKYPLHLISIVGLLISLFSFLLGILYITLRLVDYPITWGNPTLVILVSFLGGVQLLSLGIMGQYIARLYDAILERPQFIVEESKGFKT